MKKINFYSIENSIKLSDGSHTRYVENLDIVKHLIFSKLDKLLSDNSHVMIHVTYDEGNPPLYFDVFRHDISVLSDTDINFSID